MAQPYRLIISFSFIHLNMQHLLIKKQRELFTSLLCHFIFFPLLKKSKSSLGQQDQLMIKEQGSSVFRQENLSVYWCFLVQPTFSYYPLFWDPIQNCRYARRTSASYSRGDTFTPERGCFYSVGFGGKDGTFFTSSPLPCLMAVIRHQGTIIHLTAGSEKHAGSTGP